MFGEAKLFWGGGGEGLRRKRIREWEEGGWEQWVVEEDVQGNKSAVTNGEDRVGNEGHGWTGENGCNEGKVGEMRVGVVDGGGDRRELVGATGAEGEPRAERKPSRGRRREEEENNKRGEEKDSPLHGPMAGDPTHVGLIPGLQLPGRQNHQIELIQLGLVVRGPRPH